MRLRGGAATASSAGSARGGAAASLTINADGAVTLGGIIDGRGGRPPPAQRVEAVGGGAAGAIHVGETAPPPTISVLVPLVASGGDGVASAGAGGTVTPEPGTGNVNIAGPLAIDLRGGNSMSAPGAGGLLHGGARTDPGSGGVHITGEIDASGGSIMVGGSGNGADGGRVDMQLIPTDGAVSIDMAAKITVEGGASGGTGTAGGGGHVWFFTKDGDATIAGTISVRGGDAPDPGGVGGEGGMIYVFTDNNHNATTVCKGNLLVAATGMMDASGGDGATGGSGRNDGIQGLVASFPDNQEADLHLPQLRRRPRQHLQLDGERRSPRRPRRRPQRRRRRHRLSRHPAGSARHRQPGQRRLSGPVGEHLEQGRRNRPAGRLRRRMSGPRYAARGTVKKNEAPRPGSLLTPMSPPWARTMLRAM